MKRLLMVAGLALTAWMLTASLVGTPVALAGGCEGGGCKPDKLQLPMPTTIVP